MPLTNTQLTLFNEAIINACETGDVFAVSQLLAIAGVDPSMYNDKAIRCAAKGNYEIVAALLDHPDISVDAWKVAWHTAIDHRATNVVRLLLSRSGVDPTIDDNYALRKATANGDALTVKILLDDARVDPSSLDNDAYVSALRFGDDSVVQCYLKDNRADPPMWHILALRQIVSSGNTVALESFISTFTSQQQVRNDALCEAAKIANLDVATYLVNNGADPTANNFEAMRIAMMHRPTTVYDYLITLPSVSAIF